MYTHIQKIYARFISNAPILAICSKKKNYNQYIFLLFALLVNAILQNQRKKIYKYRNNTVYKKK